MSKFLSGRLRQLLLGIAGYTENKTVLQTTGKVGIGTTDAQQHSLFVVGSTNITGNAIVGGGFTAVGIGSFQNDVYVDQQLYVGGLQVVGGTTIGEDIVTRNLKATGISTFVGITTVESTLFTNQLSVSGVSTFNGNIDANDGIDIFGHTEVDNVNVSGTATITSLDVETNFDVYDTQAVFHNDLYVAGNLSIGGTTTTLNAQDLQIFDKDIILGVTTDSNGNDNSTDITANHGGIAIASTEGSPLVPFYLAGVNEDIPDTYKQLMWVQANSYGIGTTDAWLFNYAVGIGSTLVPNGTRFAVSEIQFTDDTINTPNINVAENAGVTGDLDVDGHTELDQLRVSGVSTFQSNVYLGDNDKIILGNSQDLQIYHNGFSNIIEDVGVGGLTLRGNNVYLQDDSTGGYGLFAQGLHNGAFELYYDNSKKLETTGIGVSIYNDLNVGTGVTIYGNAGIVSAISFYGDGSNLTNTGATLNATTGVERLVTTQLTSGTMVDAATDADLTFDAGTNTLNTENIKISGGISTDGSSTGNANYILRAVGDGTWAWTDVPGLFDSTNNILNGFTVRDEGSVVGSAGSIRTLDFRGGNIIANADPQPNGIATITMSDTPTFGSLNITGITTLGGPVTAGSSEGVSGQYLRHVGTGVTWTSFPPLRTTQTNVATDGQTAFNFVYNINFLDVFVNGIKLTTSEYTASNGTQIVLASPAFGGDIIEFHSYNTVSTGSGGGGGGGGASLLNDLGDVTIGTLSDNQILQYNSLNGQWENVDNIVGAGGTWATDLVGINTTKNVGIGTTAKDGYKLYVEGDARVTGILTVGPASVTIDGINNEVSVGSGITFYGNTGIISATSVNVSGIVTASAFYGDASNVTGIVTTNLAKANVYIGDNPPGIGTVSGDLWWESSTAKGHIYYDDTSSAQWVEFSPAGGGGSVGSGISFTDLSVTTASAGNASLIYNNTNGVFTYTPPDVTGFSTTTSRFVASNSTGSIGAGTTADITITGAKTYSLLKIDTSHAAWVRLYTDTTSRTNDASRAYTTDPTPGSGVLAEVYTTTTGSNTFKMTPGVVGWNDDGTPSTNIYAKVTNNESGAADITVSLTIVRMED